MRSRTRTEPGHRGSGPDALAEGLLAGDRRVLARAITLVESTRPDHRAEAAGCLAWAPRQEPYPVGYYCGLRDPDGNFVEFSYGQPLGPGAETVEHSE